MIIQEVVTQTEDWNDYIGTSPFGDILQSWEWGEVKRGELWEPIRIRALEGSKVVGQAQLLIRRLPGGFNLYYVPRGPVLDYTSASAQEILRLMMDWISQHAKRNKGMLIKLGPAVSTEQAPQASQLLTSLGLQAAAQTVQMKHTRIVDLQPSLEELLGSFDKDTRNLVRRAAKEQVIVDCFTSIKDTKALRTFHNLYLATSERGNFPARPWAQMVRLWELMAPKGMAYLYTASFEDQPLASSLVLKVGPVAYQLWSGSRRDTAKKYPTYALQWTIMQHMKESVGATSYDMWGIAPTDDPTHPWSGPTLFKKGFSGRRVDFIGDYDLAVSPLYPAYQLAMAVRQKLFGLKT